MHRTFCVDRDPEGELARICDVVRTSQAAGAAAVRPGVSAKDVDDVCRRIIAEAGWAERFEHGTGHGVGLDIHEAPTVSQLGTAILAPGFVVTVEPGVYVPGQGGVRVEDTLVVTEDGARPLTRFTKDIHGSLDPLPEERHEPGPPRGPVQRRRVPAREAGQGRRVRAHEAEERPQRRRDRAHLPGRREARAGHHRQAGHAVPLPRRRRLRVHGHDELRATAGPDGLARRRAAVPEGGRRRQPPVLRDRDRGRRPAGVGRVDGGRDRARCPRGPGVGGAQAGDALDRAHGPGAPVRGPRRRHQGRHAHRRVSDAGLGGRVAPSEGATRHQARERALLILYEAEMKGELPSSVLEELAVTPDVFAVALVRDTEEHQAEADSLIAAAAVGWPIDRLAVLDRLVLRLAVAELLSPDGPPMPVVIDEAVELAKSYSTEASGGFVNGVLSTVAARISER